MDIESKTRLTNTFSKGMNTDISDALISDEEYRLANNLRFVTDDEQNTAELHMIEGTQYVFDLKHIFTTGYENLEIMATSYVRNYGIVIVRTTGDGDVAFNDSNLIHATKTDKYWYVIAFRCDDKDNFVEYPSKSGQIHVVFGPCNHVIGDHLSLVSKYEDDDNIKVYIADGVNPICVINIAGAFKDNNFKPSGNYNTITSYPTVKFSQPVFVGLVEGTLPAGMVEYSYQYYNKYGNYSGISPTTRLIPIQNGTSGTKVKGYAQGRTSSAGVKIIIPSTSNEFDHIRIYRILYVENGQLPTIEVISDISNNNPGEDVVFVDGGSKGESTLTIEEYNSMSGIHIIPKIIESKGDYLFAANIAKEIENTVSLNILDWDARAYRYNYSKHALLYKYGYESEPLDVTTDYDIVPANHDCWLPSNDINKPLYTFLGTDYNAFYLADGRTVGGSGKNISWKFIGFDLIGDSNYARNNDKQYGKMGTLGEPLSLDTNVSFNSNSVTVTDFSTGKENITIHNAQLSGAKTYANPITSYAFKSLRRGELYRFGIILYDDRGNASPVKWIADIRVPESNYDQFYTFLSHGNAGGGVVDLVVRPIGIKFTIKNLPENVVSYEIVRSSRTTSDIKTLTQGVVSRPIRKYVAPTNELSTQTSFPLTPTGWLTTADFWAGCNRGEDYVSHSDEDELKMQFRETNAQFPYVINNWNNSDTTYAQTDGNLLVFQFVSPEVCYLQESFLSLLQQSTISITPIKYIFGCSYYDGGTVDPRTYITTKEAILYVDASGYGNDDDWCDSYTRGDEIIYPGNKLTRLYVPNKKLCSNWRHDFDIDSKARDIITMLTYMDCFWYYVPIGFENNWYGFDLFPLFVETFNRRDKYWNGDDFPTKVFPLLNRYQYIKLYELTRAPLVYKRYYTKNWSTNKNEYDGFQSMMYTGVLGSNTDPTSEIDELRFCDTLSWNDFADSTKDKGESLTLKYNKHITTIGGYQFTNWVTNGSYGKTAGNEWGSWMVGESDYWDGSYIWAGMPIGPGGKCAVLKIKDLFNDMLSFTSAADSVLSNGSPSDISLGQNHSAPASSGSGSKFGIYDKSIFRESRVGTYLCNITHSVMPYGGYTYSARQATMYLSYGDFFDASNSDAPVFNGDCYIQPMEYVSQHKAYHPSIPYLRNACIVYSIPVETNINLAITNGYEFHKNNTPTDILVEPSDVNGQSTQSEPLYVYNSVYSQNNTLQPHGAELEVDSYDLSHDTRCFYSNPKSSNENMDSWIKFMPANYLDVDTRKGPITQLADFNNKLMFWQESATGIFSVQERTALTDESNLPLILGNGGVLSRYDYLNTSNGMRENEFTNASSDNTLYWWDHNNAEICAYGDGLLAIPLSKMKNVQNFINKQKNEGKLTNTPHLFFDKKYNEIVANISNGTGYEAGSLVYNEHLNAFTGLYNINTEFSMQLPDRVYLIEEQKTQHVTDPIDNVLTTISMGETVKDLDYDLQSMDYLGLYVDDPNVSKLSVLIKHTANSYTGRIILVDEWANVIVSNGGNLIEELNSYVLDWVENRSKITYSHVSWVDKTFSLNDILVYNIAEMKDDNDNVINTSQKLVYITVGPQIKVNISDQVNEYKLCGWQWNKKQSGFVYGFDKALYPYIKYVVNDNNTVPKVYDTCLFGGRFYGGNRADITPLSFSFTTPLKQSGDIDYSAIENREYDFRFAIPRNNDSAYGDRLRGKTMQGELKSISNSYDFSLQHITTKYRISWS